MKVNKLGILVVLVAGILIAQQHVTIRDQTGTVQTTGYLTVDPILVTALPASSSVASGGTQQFSATVANSLDATVQWTASAGAIDANGLFTAPDVTVDTPVTVVATSAADATKNSTVLVMVKAKAQIVVAISPKTVTLVQGGTQQFTADVTGTGNQAINWTSTGGAIDTNGNFTAGTGASGTVTATSTQDSTKSDTALVTITTPPPPPQGALIAGEDDYLNYLGGKDGPADLPKVGYATLMSTQPAPGPDVDVPAGSSLQNAVNAAACGTKLHMQGASVYTLTSLPQKNCDAQHYIYLMPDAASYAALPAEGSRASWCSAGVSSLPGRPQQSDCGHVVNAMWKLAVTNTVSIAGSGYRIIGAEIYQAPGGTVGGLLNVVPTAGVQRITLDRCWLHGSATTNLKRAILGDGSKYFAIVNSSATDFHGDGTTVDQSGVFNMQSGPGVDKFWNNFLEAGGAPIGYGGGGNGYGTPTDIFIANNDIFKPLTWDPSSPSYVATPSGRYWRVTNNIETKNSIRTWFYHNSVKNVWGGFSQSAWQMLVTPKNQSNGTTSICPTCQVTDFVSEYNHFDNEAGLYQIANAPSDTLGYALAGMRYSFHDDLVTNLQPAVGCYQCGTGILQISTAQNAPGNFVMRDVLLNHITAVLTPGGGGGAQLLLLGGLAPPNQINMGITNSILPYGKYGIRSVGGTTDCSQSQLANGPLAQFSNCWSTPYKFTANLIVNGPGVAPALNKWPAGNLFAASVSAVGYMNPSAGDYKLQTTSPGYKVGTDGLDLGADMSKVAP